MDYREQFTSGFDPEYENRLPEQLRQDFDALELLGSSGDCDTLLVKNRTTGAKLVAKCFFGGGVHFASDVAALLAGLDSDSIPKYVTVSESDACPCILREYVEGETLAAYVKTHPMTAGTVTEIAIRLASVMKLLHEQKPPIIHRDIKPENIIIRADGSLVLIDFGISRIYKQEGTSDTVFCGTQNYAPPEQYGFMQTDMRSDIYAFGVVLSWMLTGREAPVKAPHTRLEKIAAKCCAYEPGGRYKNDDALLAELRRTTESHAARIKAMQKRCAALFLLCALVLIPAAIYTNWRSAKNAYTFREPLIEEAVRLTLGKPTGVLTKEDLLEVKEFYIFTDHAYPDMDAYFIGQSDWYALDARIHGTVASLDDVKYMENLEILYLGGNEVADLSPLRGLDALTNIYLQDNAITDISALSDKPALVEISLLGNKLKDIEPVRTWPAIQILDLAETGTYDARPLEVLKGLQVLDVNNGPDAGAYLNGLYVETLRLGWKGQTDLECIRSVAHVEKLLFNYSSIRDISALEGRTDIVYLNMESCAVTDVSPLFTMPGLLTVELSARMQPQMETLAAQYDEPPFEIVYTK